MPDTDVPDGLSENPAEEEAATSDEEVVPVQLHDEVWQFSPNTAGNKQESQALVSQEAEEEVEEILSDDDEKKGVFKDRKPFVSNPHLKCQDSLCLSPSFSLLQDRKPLAEPPQVPDSLKEQVELEVQRIEADEAGADELLKAGLHC